MSDDLLTTFDPSTLPAAPRSLAARRARGSASNATTATTTDAADTRPLTHDEALAACLKIDALLRAMTFNEFMHLADLADQADDTRADELVLHAVRVMRHMSRGQIAAWVHNGQTIAATVGKTTRAAPRLRLVP